MATTAKGCPLCKAPPSISRGWASCTNHSCDLGTDWPDLGIIKIRVEAWERLPRAEDFAHDGRSAAAWAGEYKCYQEAHDALATAVTALGDAAVLAGGNDSKLRAACRDTLHADDEANPDAMAQAYLKEVRKAVDALSTLTVIADRIEHWNTLLDTAGYYSMLQDCAEALKRHAAGLHNEAPAPQREPVQVHEPLCPDPSICTCDNEAADPLYRGRNAESWATEANDIRYAFGMMKQLLEALSRSATDAGVPALSEALARSVSGDGDPVVTNDAFRDVIHALADCRKGRRTAAQTLIEVIGAPGPESVMETSERAAAQLDDRNKTLHIIADEVGTFWDECGTDNSDGIDAKTANAMWVVMNRISTLLPFHAREKASPTAEVGSAEIVATHVGSFTQWLHTHRKRHGYALTELHGGSKLNREAVQWALASTQHNTPPDASSDTPAHFLRRRLGGKLERATGQIGRSERKLTELRQQHRALVERLRGFRCGECGGKHGTHLMTCSAADPEARAEEAGALAMTPGDALPRTYRCSNCDKEGPDGSDSMYWRAGPVIGGGLLIRHWCNEADPDKTGGYPAAPLLHKAERDEPSQELIRQLADASKALAVVTEEVSEYLQREYDDDTVDALTVLNRISTVLVFPREDAPVNELLVPRPIPEEKCRTCARCRDDMCTAPGCGVFAQAAGAEVDRRWPDVTEQDLRDVTKAALKRYGGVTMFNSACFAGAFREHFGLAFSPDGGYVKAILISRPWVSYTGSAHWSVKPDLLDTRLCSRCGRLGAPTNDDGVCEACESGSDRYIKLGSYLGYVTGPDKGNEPHEEVKRWIVEIEEHLRTHPPQEQDAQNTQTLDRLRGLLRMLRTGDSSCSACEEVEGQYQQVITAVLECDPIPANKTAHGELEKPWEVIRRTRLRAETAEDALQQLRKAAVVWATDAEKYCGDGCNGCAYCQRRLITGEETGSTDTESRGPAGTEAHCIKCGLGQRAAGPQYTCSECSGLLIPMPARSSAEAPDRVWLVRHDSPIAAVSHVAASKESAEWLRDSDERVEPWTVERKPRRSRHFSNEDVGRGTFPEHGGPPPRAKDDDTDALPHPYVPNKTIAEMSPFPKKHDPDLWGGVKRCYKLCVEGVGKSGDGPMLHLLLALAEAVEQIRSSDEAVRAFYEDAVKSTPLQEHLCSFVTYLSKREEQKRRGPTQQVQPGQEVRVYVPRGINPLATVPGEVLGQTRAGWHWTTVRIGERWDDEDGDDEKARRPGELDSAMDTLAHLTGISLGWDNKWLPAVQGAIAQIKAYRKESAANEPRSNMCPTCQQGPFTGYSIETDTGPYGICARDFGIELLRDGAMIFSSRGSGTDQEHDTLEPGAAVPWLDEVETRKTPPFKDCGCPEGAPCTADCMGPPPRWSTVENEAKLDRLDKLRCRCLTCGAKQTADWKTTKCESCGGDLVTEDTWLNERGFCHVCDKPMSEHEVGCRPKRRMTDVEARGCGGAEAHRRDDDEGKA